MRHCFSRKVASSPLCSTEISSSPEAQRISPTFERLLTQTNIWKDLLKQHAVPDDAAAFISLMHLFWASKNLATTEDLERLRGMDPALSAQLAPPLRLLEETIAAAVASQLAQLLFPDENITWQKKPPSELIQQLAQYSVIPEMHRLREEFPQLSKYSLKSVQEGLNAHNRTFSLPPAHIVTLHHIANYLEMLMAQQTLMGNIHPLSPSHHYKTFFTNSSSSYPRFIVVCNPFRRERFSQDLPDPLCEQSLIKHGQYGYATFIHGNLYYYHANPFPLGPQHANFISGTVLQTLETESETRHIYPPQLPSKEVVQDLSAIQEALPEHRLIFNFAQLIGGKDPSKIESYLFSNASNPYHLHVQVLQFSFPIENAPMEFIKRIDKTKTSYYWTKNDFWPHLVLTATNSTHASEEVMWTDKIFREHKLGYKLLVTPLESGGMQWIFSPRLIRKLWGLPKLDEVKGPIELPKLDESGGLVELSDPVLFETLTLEMIRESLDRIYPTFNQFLPLINTIRER